MSFSSSVCGTTRISSLTLYVCGVKNVPGYTVCSVCIDHLHTYIYIIYMNYAFAAELWLTLIRSPYREEMDDALDVLTDPI